MFSSVFYLKQLSESQQVAFSRMLPFFARITFKHALEQAYLSIFKLDNFFFVAFTFFFEFQKPPFVQHTTLKRLEDAKNNQTFLLLSQYKLSHLLKMFQIRPN